MTFCFPCKRAQHCNMFPSNISESTTCPPVRPGGGGNLVRDHTTAWIGAGDFSSLNPRI